MKKNNMVAMILAGGRGSRLYALTDTIAKPAVHYGGKYRIIDFPLSNCANSNISTVGVLLQYESVVLGSYCTREMTWGLDMNGGGVYALSPREKDAQNLSVYRGTADAITQNIDFLDENEPDYVLILSGDHIYKMNYEKMLKEHIKAKADATIAVMEVPLKEASRFGIMNCDKNDTIVEFEEKPKHPKSNLASMGIYIFSYKTLRKYLKADEKMDSNHDFGKDIIPAYLADGLKLQAYRFKGYWKDVGTISSLWEANMDLLDPNCDLNLYEQDWKIYSDDGNPIPQNIGEKAEVADSLITQGARVDGLVNHSVIFTDCDIKEGAKIYDSVVMTGSKVGKNAVLNRCLVADKTNIPAGMKLGSKDSEDILLVTNKMIAELKRGKKNGK